MDINKYALFVKAAELGNLTKAAEQLGYTQTAASHMLSSFEAELGVKVLHRGRKGASLTKDGEHILELAKEIVDNNKKIYQLTEQGGARKGKVRVGVITSVAVQWFPKIMKEFRKEYPLIELQVNDAINYEWVKEWFYNDQVDCAFTVESGKSGGKEIPLITDPYYVIMSENHPLCQYENIGLDMLEGETFIIPSEGMHYSVGEIVRRAKGKILEHSGFLSDQVTIALVRGECGISILPKLVLDSCICDGIARRKLEPEMNRTIYLCVQSSKNISEATKVFINYVKQYM